MTMYQKIIAITVLLGWVTFATAAELSAPQQLSALLRNINSMRANFTQVATGKHARLHQTTRGSMALLKPARFRWDIREPTQQLIVADGSRLWVYDIDLRQATVQSLQSSVGNSPAMILSGNISALMQGYTISRLPIASNKGIAFALRARNNNVVYRAADLYFDKKNVLRQMNIVDNLGQHSNVNFSQVQLNPRIATSLFVFHPPRGVDVIRR